MAAIKLFVTGGSIDKIYDPIVEKLQFNNSHISDMLKTARCTVDIDVRVLMMIDSLQMGFTDRQLILENCRTTPEDRIVITHGTSTMCETAKVLGQAIEDKTIILTGSMYPYEVGNWDALFNLGTAIAYAQSMPHGVYVAMNGQCFNWYNVKKNEKIGLFETL
jgi:L-asparaginase